jgi:hypothetical protein
MYHLLGNNLIKSFYNMAVGLFNARNPLKIKDVGMLNVIFNLFHHHINPLVSCFPQ